MEKQSVVIVTQIYTVDKNDLEEKIGSLSAERIEQILSGLDLVLKAR